MLRLLPRAFWFAFRVPIARRLFAGPVLAQVNKFHAFPQTIYPSAGKSNKPYGYVLLIFPISFFLLGCWQVQRRQWKKDLLKRLKERINSEPLILPSNLKDLKDMEFCRFLVRGTFDHEGEFLIPMRMRKDAPFTEKRYHFLVDEHSPVGVHVVTPFLLTDRNCRILINRGWVPNKYADPKSRANGQINGEVELVAVNRLSEKRPPFVTENNPFRNHWFYRDVDAMANFHNTLPIYLEADYESTVPDGPIGGQTNVHVSDNHTAYIFTWWTLSALTSYMWFSMFL